MKIPQLRPINNRLERPVAQLMENHIVLCGFGRVGRYIGRAFELAQVPIIVIDYNHSSLLRAKDKGIPIVNGDPSDREILRHAQIERARMLIIAIPDRHTQELVISNARSINKQIQIICRSHHEEDQKILKALGVDAIIQPEFEAAITIVARTLLQFGKSNQEIMGKISRLKIEHGLG